MKGSMLSRFHVGQVVAFSCNSVPGKARITKLHKSGSFGCAKIKPMDGSRSRTRKLQNLWSPRD